MKDIKDVFKKHLKHITFNKNFYKQLHRFRVGWMNKNDDTIEFLGGNLLGVNPVRFSVRDEEVFYLDILEVDVVYLKEDLHALEDIDPTRHVTSNPFYLTVAYLLHGFTKSSLDRKLKEEALKEVYFIFAYKAISSAISHFFKYNLDRAIAIAVHESLTNRFLIKQLGTWQAVFEHRAKDVLPKGLHAKRVVNLTTYDATRIVMDIQGRLREMIKNIYVVIMDVKDNGVVIESTTLETMDGDDESLKSIIHRPDVYLNYIKSIVPSRNDFIKDDLLHVVTSLVSSLEHKSLLITLEFISKNYVSEMNKLDNAIVSIVELSISYLMEKKMISGYDKNIESVLVILRNYWSSSKLKEKRTKDTKIYIQKITQKATGRKTKWMLTTTTIGVVLYVVLRTMAKNMYK